MSTNNDTVLKLSDALSELIEAYEKLQKENDDIKTKNAQLEEALASIKNEKATLETNVNQLSESSEKQETNINSMLGKIESLLGVKNNPKKELRDIVIEEPEVSKDEAQELEENIFNVPTQHEATAIKAAPELETNGDTINTEINTPNKNNEEEDNNKLDLNRMASLLNGFNK